MNDSRDTRTERLPPAILHPDELAAYDRGSGVQTIPLVTRAVGAQAFLNGMTMFQGGAGLPLHTHNCAESAIVLEGEAVAEIDGIEHRLSRWDTTYVDAGVPHRFCNASDTVPMRIFWIYASVDATRTIIETGITSRVDIEYDAGHE
jgi:quercetin dioxygenase-like cupin family protein